MRQLGGVLDLHADIDGSPKAPISKVLAICEMPASLQRAFSGAYTTLVNRFEHESEGGKGAMKEFGGGMRCGDEIREDGVAPVPVADTCQHSHKDGPNTRRPHQQHALRAAGCYQPKSAQEFEDGVLIGAEGPVQSCLVKEQNKRNSDTERDRRDSEYCSRKLTNRNVRGRKSYCGAFTVEGKSFDGTGTQYVRVDCKCWNCAHCAPIRARLYRRGIREAATEHNLARFLTLTLDPSKIQGDPIPYLRETFNKFRVYLHRKFGNAPKYIAVVELQKNGNPHLHILIDRYIEQAWIKSAWEAIGGGFKVDIRYVDIHRVSRYVSKYLTDDLLFSAPAGTRRITCSHSIKL